MKKNNMLTRLVTLLLAAFTVLTVTVMAAHPTIRWSR